MALTKIKKGLDLPIAGVPDESVIEEKPTDFVAILGDDFTGMKPTMEVSEGDEVKLGQVVFTDKKTPGIKYTAPGTGKVVEINRGEKRKFLSLVIKLEGKEQITFKSFSLKELDSLKQETVKEQLLDSGLWTALKARPFGKVADPETYPQSIFVTAMDTRPLAPLTETLLRDRDKEFEAGLRVLSRLTEKVYVCKAQGSALNVPDIPRISVEKFMGPHPAGLPGTHIHFISPVHRGKIVWHLDATDVADIGELFTTGQINTECTVALAGPAVKKPRLIKTRKGAFLQDIIENELVQGKNRVISGSVLDGNQAVDAVNYLGRYHHQISVLSESGERVFLGWTSFSPNLYSIKPLTLAFLFPQKRFDFTTNQHGSRRAIVPLGTYEKVMPLDILPTPLFRALAVDDLDEAEKLGVLELIEEDVSLCSFVCPAKQDHAAALRRNLTIMEKEG